MLKLKDNVDLKKLEKLGYTRHEYDTELSFENKKSKFIAYTRGDTVIILNDDRYVEENCEESTWNYSDDIYDLVKADLVEKAEY